MKAITIEDVMRAKEFAAKHSVRITKQLWYHNGDDDRGDGPGGKCCCPVTALCAKTQDLSPRDWWLSLVAQDFFVASSNTLGIPREYLHGFINGVDGGPIPRDSRPEFADGYEDGVAVRKALGL